MGSLPTASRSSPCSWKLDKACTQAMNTYSNRKLKINLLILIIWPQCLPLANKALKLAYTKVTANINSIYYAGRFLRALQITIWHLQASSLHTTDEGTKAQTGNLQKVTVVVNLQCKSGLSGSRFCALNHMPDSLS